MYYIYVYLDPRKSGQYKYGSYEFECEPFYVGKGKDKRLKVICNRTVFFKRIINRIKKSKLKPIIVKIQENLNENDSFILESKLIKLIGRKDSNKGPLINFTDGGEGNSGRIVSKKMIEEISKKQRKDFSDIQKKFEERKYALLTEEKDYKNAFTKLNYICHENHKGSISWSDFHHGYGCPICGTELRAKKQRKNFSDIKNEFKKRGYELLTTENEYINNRQKLNYICSIDHKHSISWANFQQGRCCPSCVRNKWI